MLKYILPLTPEHQVYVECFFGGGAVFWAKPLSGIEIINDLNSEVINFIDVVQNQYLVLENRIKNTLYARATHEKAGLIYSNPHLFSDVERAWAFWVQCNMSFGTFPLNGWAYGASQKPNQKVRNKGMTIYNKIKSFSTALQERLYNVEIENKDAVTLVKARDKEEVFFYLDPPYVGANQGHYSGYRQSDFKDLLEVLTNIKGKFLLSSYPNTELTKFVKKYGWIVEEIDRPLSVSNIKGKPRKRKIEVLTRNYKV